MSVRHLNLSLIKCDTFQPKKLTKALFVNVPRRKRKSTYTIHVLHADGNTFTIKMRITFCATGAGDEKCIANL